MPPIPPIPPMPPIPPPMAGASSLGKSVTTHSAVVSRDATPEASTSAVRTTYIEITTINASSLLRIVVKQLLFFTHLCGIDDAGFHHIDKLSNTSVVTFLCLHDSGNDLLCVNTGVTGDREARNLQRFLHDVDTLKRKVHVHSKL